jgi:hypothetical protein
VGVLVLLLSELKKKNIMNVVLISPTSYFGTCGFPKNAANDFEYTSVFFNRHNFVGSCKYGTLEFFQFVITSL